MNELQEIANSLANDKTSLASSLFKLKILAERLENPELNHWLKNELTGYENTEKIPDYRKTKGFLLVTNNEGDYVNFTQFQEVDTIVEYINALCIYDDIARIEYTMKGNPQHPLQMPINDEYKQLIYDVVTNVPGYGNSPEIGLYINIAYLASILSNVRYFALGLLIQLENKFVLGVETKELIFKKQDCNNFIKEYFDKTPFNK